MLLCSHTCKASKVCNIARCVETAMPDGLAAFCPTRARTARIPLSPKSTAVPPCFLVCVACGDDRSLPCHTAPIIIGGGGQGGAWLGAVEGGQVHGRMGPSQGTSGTYRLSTVYCGAGWRPPRGQGAWWGSGGSQLDGFKALDTEDQDADHVQ